MTDEEVRQALREAEEEGYQRGLTASKLRVQRAEERAKRWDEAWITFAGRLILERDEALRALEAARVGQQESAA